MVQVAYFNLYSFGYNIFLKMMGQNFCFTFEVVGGGGGSIHCIYRP